MAVTISRGFWMGKYEVTQGEYLAVTGSNPSVFSTNVGMPEDLSRPVDGERVLVRCHELLRHTHPTTPGGGVDRDQQCVSAADGGGVGVCVPGVDFNAFQLWR
jgi:hypothetical protein